MASDSLAQTSQPSACNCDRIQGFQQRSGAIAACLAAAKCSMASFLRSATVLSRRSLVIVRLPLVEATRAWRQGVRTVILLNDTLPLHLARRRDYRRHAPHEVYLTYQDVDNSAVWWLKKGDLRCASSETSDVHL